MKNWNSHFSHQTIFVPLKTQSFSCEIIAAERRSSRMRDQRVQLTRVLRLRMQYLEEDPNITRNLACQRSRLPAMYLEFYPRVRHDIVA